ncbi:hypothetical protein K488DRAFT_72928 [Vararia minispora EC-137]|uniref:Uncharacterized protein n=1 Tax=Vararia minispora EC-137 TaxID=1314806 RepID=A0ACB8QD58_9AGAM|nr:hypothetical protein K488DRAFT_72928 [Vararia minispora EC-137]
MFASNVLVSLFVIVQLVSAAPLRVRSISNPAIVKARGRSSACMMDTTMMGYNLAGAMNSMSAVQSAILTATRSNDENVQTVQNGIMGAMTSLTVLTGSMANGANVPSYVSGAMIGNLTMSLNDLDAISGVPTSGTAAELDAAQQQLINASQFAMSIPSNCLGASPMTPSGTSGPSTSATPTASRFAAPTASMSAAPRTSSSAAPTGTRA